MFCSVTYSQCRKEHYTIRFIQPLTRWSSKALGSSYEVPAYICGNWWFLQFQLTIRKTHVILIIFTIYIAPRWMLFNHKEIRTNIETFYFCFYLFIIIFFFQHLWWWLSMLWVISCKCRQTSVDSISNKRSC